MLSIYDLMEINKPIFTENDTIIYNSFKDYPGMIERYTVSQLAEFLNISTTSIMRFAKKLGYSGYSELRFEYMKSAHTVQSDSDSSSSDLKQYIKLMTESFERFSSIDEDCFVSLARDIKKHKSVFAIGIGKSGLVAEYMRYSFIRAGKYIKTATDSVMINDLPKDSNSQNLYLYFSERANPASDILKTFLKDARSNPKAKIVLVTFNPKTTYESMVDDIIVLPNVDTKQEGIRSHSLMLGFIDILLTYYLKCL